jgi:hypothetical protein
MEPGVRLEYDTQYAFCEVLVISRYHHLGSYIPTTKVVILPVSVLVVYFFFYLFISSAGDRAHGLMTNFSICASKTSISHDSREGLCH